MLIKFNLKLNLIQFNILTTLFCLVSKNWLEIGGTSSVSVYQEIMEKDPLYGQFRNL